MTDLTIVSNEKGIGKLFLSKLMLKPEDLSGHPFFIGNQELKIGKDNIVTIPLKLMKNFGYLRTDGRYAVPIQISYRHVKGVKAVGGRIIKSPNLGKYLEIIKDGQSLPKAAVVDDIESLETLEPADIPEWTQSGDY